jgi:protein-L-isoaspartate(D-aspartate) O-methyltransferase
MNNETHEALRREMVEWQLRDRGIRSASVLRVMAEIPREKFIAPDQELAAYEDRALAIDCGQTISQPYIVALMTEALQLTGVEHVLEIGTGSGYQTAILSRLAHDVVSIERHAALSQQAAHVLCELGCHNVTLLVGDGSVGYAAGAPYDRIIVTAAAEQLPPALWNQLRERGILVIPLGPEMQQYLMALHKIGGQPREVTLCPCRFVPLIAAPANVAPERPGG